MKINLQLAPCFLFLALMCANHAFSQESNGGASPGDLESYAKMVFREDISAGRLTVQKATALFKCANDRYAEKLTPEQASDLSDAMKDLNKHRDNGTELSGAEKERYGRAYKNASKLQQEAEDSCRKELSIDPSVKRIFKGSGSKRK
jgi:hypothetical protein